MVNRLAKLPNFTVVERAKVNTVLKEQDFGASGRVKKGTQARTGQIRGADYTLMGDIVVFGRDDKSKSVYGGGGVPGAAGGGGVKRREDKAVVVFAYRLVDNESSEIILSGEARGESKRSSTSGFAGFWAGPVIAGGGFNFASQNFAETIIGEATIDACDKLAQDIAAKAGQVPKDKDVEIEALVAAVEGAQVYINAGSAAGVQVGDKFAIQRVVKEVRDPVTKEVLDAVVEPAAMITITQVREKISIGALQGGGTVKAGDRAVKQ
jgi:curli biogenesis system outer membrane secretion channel CsgG